MPELSLFTVFRKDFYTLQIDDDHGPRVACLNWQTSARSSIAKPVKTGDQYVISMKLVPGSVECTSK
ncbi:hypothetical protein [Aquabacter cavernae]|uniref:hypothetical protein n=1 Tax=Aquabacter cavernae TaxID=2496029 RepID=UPI000F8C4284|nr:hypothetical protein [Aquabacter cavernae]